MTFSAFRVIGFVAADHFQEAQDVSGFAPVNAENALGVPRAALQLRYRQS